MKDAGSGPWLDIVTVPPSSHVPFDQVAYMNLSYFDALRVLCTEKTVKKWILDL